MMKPTVLIVDDEPEMITIAASFLSGAGYAVIPATDGSQAVRAIKEAAVDVILTDMRMPRPDCWDLLDEVRRSGRPTQTVIMTGCGTTLLHREAEARGACAVLEKPFSREALLAAVELALKKAEPAAAR